jgi:hypothetical protein
VLDSHVGYTTSCHQRSARNVSFAPRAGGPNKCTTLRASDLPDPRGDDVQMVNTINSTNPIPINTASATGSYSSQCRLSECSILFNAYFSCGGDDRWPRQAILDTGPSPVRWPARLCLRCVDGREWGKSSKPINLGRCKSGARSSPGTASKASRSFSQNSERRHQRSLRTVRMSYGGSSDQYLPLARSSRRHTAAGCTPSWIRIAKWW